MPDDLLSLPSNREADPQSRALTLTLALDQIRDSLDEDENPQRMFDAVVRLLRDQFSADACAVVLLTETSADEIDAVAAVGMPQGAALDLCRAAMAQHTPGAIENPYVTHAIGNQIALRDTPLGGLILARSDSPFTADEIALLEIAERQIDSAILQARTMSKLMQRNRELEAIYQADSLRDTIDSERALLRGFVKLIAECFNAETTLIFTTDSHQFIDRRGLTHAALHEIRAAAEQITIPQVIPSPHGYTEMVLLAAPFIIAGERIGAVVVGRADLFTVADHRLMFALTSQIDSAIHELRERSSSDILPSAGMSGIIENASLRYVDNRLFADDISVAEIAAAAGTPVYVYSLRRILQRLHEVRSAFDQLQPEIVFSARANGNLAVLRAVQEAGAGICCVSGGEIFRALRAGTPPEKIVFGGAIRTSEELDYAVRAGVGWIHVNNAEEIDRLEMLGERHGKTVRVALVCHLRREHLHSREISLPFGMSDDEIRQILPRMGALKHIRAAAIRAAGAPDTLDEAIAQVRGLLSEYPQIQTICLGEDFLSGQDEAEAVERLSSSFRNYHVILEPGSSLIADAGILVTRVESLRMIHEGAETRRFAFVDAAAGERRHSALSAAQQCLFSIAPVIASAAAHHVYTIMGTTGLPDDIWEDGIWLPELSEGDLLAVSGCGAYGMGMENNFHARSRPAEATIAADGRTWQIARRRETWEDQVQWETGD
jgi:diaminopimelate decarboxylase